MKNLTLLKQTFGGQNLFARLAAIVFFAALLTAALFHAAFAQATAPTLGDVQSFAILGASTVTNTGPTVVTGDVGVYAGSAVTGFLDVPSNTYFGLPPGTNVPLGMGLVTAGAIHLTDIPAFDAQAANSAVYLALAGQSCLNDSVHTFGVPTDLGGMTLFPGVYCFASSAGLTGTLTLDALGDPNAVWVFQVGSTLITEVNSSVKIINGGQNCNVFWQVGSSATLKVGTTFIGNIFALNSVHLQTNATLSGRALAQVAAVTLDSNTVGISVCAVPPVTPIPPTIGKAFSPATIPANGTSTLTITLTNPGLTAANNASFTDTLPTVPFQVTVAPGTQFNGCGGTLTTPGNVAVQLLGGSIPAGSSCTLTVPVTAASGGGYINTIAIGALVTSNGSNAAPAVATLTVPAPAIGPIAIGKAFSPATINPGGPSTLTITLSNTDPTDATNASFTDNLLPGVVVVGSAINTCGGTLTLGPSTISLTGGVIPYSSSCTVTVPVAAPLAGTYFNSIGIGALTTTIGSNTVPAVSTLTVPPLSGAAPGGESPYTAIVGNDIAANPLYFSPKYQQFLFNQAALSVPTCYGTFPPTNQYTRVGVAGCEQFRSQTPTIQPEVCDLNGAGITPPFLFRGLSNAKTPAGNAGFYEWWIRLPRKPSGEINIVIQCGVVKPNAFAVYDFDSVALCAAETGERIGAGTCVRQEVDPGVSPVVNIALPKITAIAYPGPYNDFTPFNLTAFKNPSAYTLAFDVVTSAMSNNGNAQVLDGSSNTRVLLKSCMDKTVVAKLPVTGQGNALGQTETDLEAGDLIKVRMDVPRQNTVDIYCHAQSARLAGVAE